MNISIFHFIGETVHNLEQNFSDDDDFDECLRITALLARFDTKVV